MRRTASMLVAVLLLAACEGTPDVGLEPSTEEPSPTASAVASAADGEAASASPSPTPAADIDVTTTPDEVTPEWVTAVVNTLLAEYGEMTAEILAMPVQEDPTLPQGFDERLDALFDGEYLERRRQALRGVRTDDDGIRAELLPVNQYGGLRFRAEAVQFSQESCIIAVGRISRELTVPEGGQAEGLSAVSLVPKQTDEAITWVVTDELANIAPDGSENPDDVMLGATLDDYGAALDHQCGDA